MTDTKMNPEFKSQVFKLLYGQVTEEERGAIEKQLQTDKKAVAWYAEQVMICMALRNNQAVKTEH